MINIDYLVKSVIIQSVPKMKVDFAYNAIVTDGGLAWFARAWILCRYFKWFCINCDEISLLLHDICVQLTSCLIQSVTERERERERE